MGGRLLVDGLNDYFKKISASLLKVGNEPINYICFWATVKGNLPPLSHIFRNPDTLGKYFKNA